MNTTHIGKIGRLPHNLREQLNLKLHDGLPAKSILPWLNSLPEVKAILAADFDHRPISKQNLSEWKQGGFRDWLLQYHAAHFLQFLPVMERGLSCPQQHPLSGAAPSGQEAIRPTERDREPKTQPVVSLSPSDGERAGGEGEFGTHQATSAAGNSAFCIPHSSLLPKLLLWTQLQYTSMARHIDSETDPDRKWNSLRQFATDISRLRRSDLAQDYLQIQRDWLALSQTNTADKKEKEFWNWTKRPDIQEKINPGARRKGFTPEALYELEKKACLLDGPGPEVAELMAEVRIAKRLLEIRKAKEAEAKLKADPDYDPEDPPPLPATTVKLAGMPFEELFPTIPEIPLTETHPQLDPEDPDRGQYESKESNADIPLGAGSPAQGSTGRAATGQSGPSHEQAPTPSASLSSTAGEGQGEQALSSAAPFPSQLHLADESPIDPSDSVQPSQTESNQIQPESPLNPEPNPNNDNPF